MLKLVFLFTVVSLAPSLALGQDNAQGGKSEHPVNNIPAGFKALVVYLGPMPGTLEQIRRAYPVPTWPDQKVVWGWTWNDYKGLQVNSAVFAIRTDFYQGQKEFDLFYIDDAWPHRVARIERKSRGQRYFWGPLKKIGLAFLAEVGVHAISGAMPVPIHH